MKLHFHRNWLGIGGVLSGTALVLCGPIGVSLALVMTGVVAMLVWKRRWRDAAIAGTAFALAVLSAAYAQSAYRPLDRDRRGTFMVRITDANAVGVIPGDEEALERRVIAEIEADGEPRTVRVYFTKKCPNPGVMAGELREVVGTLHRSELPVEYLKLQANGEWEDVSSQLEHNSFQHYLVARRVTADLVVETISAPLSEEGAGFFAKLRRTLLLRLDRGVASARRRAILGAMTLGMRGRLSTLYKEEYQKAGAVHLFSVSGLHVGVLAGLLLLLLRPMPLRYHALLLLSIIGYVLLTGGNAPAIRAFVLILAAEFLRAKALYVRPLEILGLIGALLLLWNPFYLTDAGFQFSFIITGFLILAAKPAREIAIAGRGRAVRYGEFSRAEVRHRRWRGRLLAAIFMAAVASVSGMALSLYHQSYFFAGAMLVNLLILPALAPLFLFSVLKCLIPAWYAVWNPVLELLLGYLDGLIVWTQKFVSLNEYAIPGVVGTASFGILLALVLLGRRYRWGIVMLCGVCAWLAFRVFAAGLVHSPIAVFISGGTLNDPVVAIMEPWAHTMKVLNAGYAGVYPLRNVARHYGVSRIMEIGFSRASVHVANGLVMLEKNFIVEKMRLPAKPIRSKAFRGMLARFPDAAHGAKEAELESPAPGVPGAVRWETTPRGTYLVTFGNQRVEIPRTAAVRVQLVELSR